MDVIALRKRSGTITGEVRVNGFPQDRTSFRRCSGYVEQFSVQSPELTVRETVLFSARLRLDRNVIESNEKVLAFADQVIESVELTELAGSLVGSDEGVGLSFEQKKRLSIAVELAASPSIVFLDEPTSGLDARSALLVVRLLRKISNEGRTVTATIHQPSSTIFGMFDDLLLLKRGGEVVYHGELGENCQSLVNYFESKGAPEIALGDNPANWMLRVITSESMGDLSQAYKESTQYTKLKQELEEAKASPSEELKIEFDSEFAASKSTRGLLIAQRLRTIYWRSPAYNLSRVMLSLMMAIILGSVFVIQYGKDVFTEVEIRARFSVVFLAFIIIGIMSMFSVLPVMTKIRDMYYRHSDSGMYDSRSIGIALVLAEKWFIVGSSMLFCVVFLAIADLGGSFQQLFWFWGFFALNSALYSYFGQLFVACVEPARTAIILCSVYIGLNNFFAGLIVRPQEMNTGFFMLPYSITPGRYVYEGMITSIFSNDDRLVEVVEGDLFYDFLVDNGYCQASSVGCEGTVSNYVEYFFGGEYQRDNILRNAIILGGILVLARILLWAALKYIRFSN
uniref:ABC transporter domain-containing protein n=1 Tax=Amphora coffeiformis TaxID=265554 RepID=A0A7S3LEU5_9STRA